MAIRFKDSLRATIVACSLLLFCNVAHAELFGLTSSNELISFSAASPATTSAPLPITGLNAGDALRGIDFRPATGALYGFAQNGTTGRLYSIDKLTGTATLSSTLSTPLSGSVFGIDFNPVPDRLRLVSDADQNLRVNVDTGATTVDGTLSYATGDPNFGVNPNVVAAGYTNSVPGVVSSTQLFVIDSNLGILGLQNPPNNGTLTSIGALGATVGVNTPFDIEGATGFAYAILGGNALSQINLTTGAATFLGNVGTPSPIIGLSAEVSARGVRFLHLCELALPTSEIA
jgi:Domain of unknown function (DUF4394)